MTRDYTAVRKAYVASRTEEIIHQPGFRAAGNWRRAAKAAAYDEFEEFVRAQREQAVADHMRDIGSSRPPQSAVDAGVDTMIEAYEEARQIPDRYPRSRARTVLIALYWLGWRPVADPRDRLDPDA